MNSYDVRFWDPRKIGDTARGRWRVRWSVAGREHCRSFPARPLADGFLTGLHNAVRDRRPFNPDTGLPAAGEAGGRGRLSAGTSTPAPTPKPSGRTWPPPPAARPPRR